MTTTSLHIRPDPFNDESALGYLLRLAEVNGYRWAKRLLADARQYQLRGPVADIAKYVAISGGQYSACAALTLRELRADLLGKPVLKAPARFTSGHYARYCPDCLCEAAYWRASWELVFSLYCHRHRCWLIDTCGACGQKLRVWRTSLMHCRCGQHLGETEAAPIPEEGDRGLALADLLQRGLDSVLPVELMAPLSDWPPELLLLSPASFHRLVLLLGAYASGHHRDKPRKLGLQGNVSQAWELVTTAEGVLSHWPARFHGLLEQQLISAGPKRGLRARLGYLYMAVYRELVEPEFAFIHQAFEHFMRGAWDEAISRRNRRFIGSMVEQAAYLPAPHVARACRVPRARLRELVDQGEIQGRIVNLPSGRERVLIARAELLRVAALTDALDLRETATRLALPERRVIDLLDAGLLSGKRPAPGASWEILRVDIDRLSGGLLSVAAHPAPVGAVSLAKVMRHYLRPDESFAGMIGAVLDHSLPAYRSEQTGNLATLAFERSSLQCWRLRDQTSFSVPELAVRLNIKQEVAYHLVRNGLITAEQHGRQGWRISRKDIAQFETLYVFARDLAKRLGALSVHLVDTLSKAGIKPVAGPQIDGCRQIIFLSESLPSSLLRDAVIKRF